eukprot:7918494-Pyramimonas_sp.AAC.1
MTSSSVGPPASKHGNLRTTRYRRTYWDRTLFKSLPNILYHVPAPYNAEFMTKESVNISFGMIETLVALLKALLRTDS